MRADYKRVNLVSFGSKTDLLTSYVIRGRERVNGFEIKYSSSPTRTQALPNPALNVLVLKIMHYF